MMVMILSFLRRNISTAFICLLLSSAALFSVSAQDGESESEQPQQWEAKLVLIDKLTAQTTEAVIAIPSVTSHEHLEINARKCWVEESSVTPEHALLSEIYMNHRNKPQRIFYGWLLKNNTELSHISNAKYDIQLLECRIKQSD